MDLLLNGKVAVVTGASKGIGLAVTRALADEGAHVIAGARTIASLEDIPGVIGVALDLGEPTSTQQLSEPVDHAPDVVTQSQLVFGRHYFSLRLSEYMPPGVKYGCGPLDVGG